MWNNFRATALVTALLAGTAANAGFGTRLIVVLAFGVLGETLNALQWLGAMLVLSSVAAIALMTHTTSTT